MYYTEEAVVYAEEQHTRKCAGAAGDEHLQQCVTADHQVFYPVEYDNRADIPAQVEYAEYRYEVGEQQCRNWQINGLLLVHWHAGCGGCPR
jgi:hypothetical protein